MQRRSATQRPSRLVIMFAVLATIALMPQLALGQGKRKPGARQPAKNALPSAQGRGKGQRIRIAPVNPEWKQQVQQSAATIDQLVDAAHQHYEVQPNAKTTDEQFVRRIYLDITGTIPTHAQAKNFLSSADPEKRSKLIDRLLNSPGYASHMFNYWGDILRLVDRPDPNIIATPYNEWVKQAIRDNMPYDQMVREMLTAEGRVWNNPAAGYTLRDAGMPLDAMNNTVRVFLGTRIGCAQCHDHPFDRWKQREFYQMAAFTAGTQTRLTRRDPELSNGNPLNRLREELKKVDPKNKGVGTFTRLVRANTYFVRDHEHVKLRLPEDYAYKDAQPGDVVLPKVIFGDDVDLSSGKSRREIFADWMTSKSNPRFTGTIANRLWKLAMGVGQIEPADDIQDGSRPENMPLMRFLIAEMQRLDFDLKEFLRILYHTEAYQRQASKVDLAGGEVYHFPGPALRRMTAEQVWDSLLTLAIYHPDSIQRPATEGIAEVADLDLTKITARELQRKADEFDEKFGRKAMIELYRQQNYKGQLLARASELPMPLPPDHFLRQFGQGDRELIESASTDGTVPQILAMFNGPVTHMMLEKGSVIYDNVMKAGSVNDQIDVIFLSLLSRSPSSSDRSLALREMRQGAAGYGNVIWALLNTREFLFIQ